MDRETKSFTTPGGKVVVVNAYLTGREANEVKAIITSGIKMSIDDVSTGDMSMGDIPSDIIEKQQQKELEKMLVSLDGNPENVYDAVLDLPESEYDAVVKAVKEIRHPLAETK